MTTQPIVPTITFEAALGNAIHDVAGRPILDMAGREILDYGMRSVKHLLRASADIELSQGIEGIGPTDLVADPGYISGLLDNRNDEFAPDHAQALSRFKNGLTVKLGIAHGVNLEYTRGRIGYIEPDSAPFGREATQFMAFDWMNKASQVHPVRIPVLLNKRDDQLIEALLANMSDQPRATDMALGVGSYLYAFHNFQDEDAYAIGVLQAIAQSGLGYIFVRSDADYGETLVYQSRATRLEDDTPVATLNNSMKDVRVSRDENLRVRKVTVYVNPAIIDIDPTTVLYTRTDEFEIPAGATKQFEAYYKDPSNPTARIAGIDGQQPVPGTDFNFSSTSGSGSDLNGELQFVGGVVFGGNKALVTVRNKADVTGYLLAGFQLRGKGIYLYEQASKSAEDPALKVGQELELAMPYNPSIDFAQDIASDLLAKWSTEESTINGATFVANRSEELMQALFAKVGQVVGLSNPKTGLNGLYHLQHRHLSIRAGGRFIVGNWSVVLASFGQFWRLGVPGLSELGETTILGV